MTQYTTFLTALTDKRIASYITEAGERVLYAAPGIHT